MFSFWVSVFFVSSLFLLPICFFNSCWYSIIYKKTADFQEEVCDSLPSSHFLFSLNPSTFFSFFQLLISITAVWITIYMAALIIRWHTSLTLTLQFFWLIIDYYMTDHQYFITSCELFDNWMFSCVFWLSMINTTYRLHVYSWFDSGFSLTYHRTPLSISIVLAFLYIHDGEPLSCGWPSALFHRTLCVPIMFSISPLRCFLFFLCKVSHARALQVPVQNPYIHTKFRNTFRIFFHPKGSASLKENVAFLNFPWYSLHPDTSTSGSPKHVKITKAPALQY